jgi:hypothetical protein
MLDSSWRSHLPVPPDPGCGLARPSIAFLLVQIAANVLTNRQLGRTGGKACSRLALEPVHAVGLVDPWDQINRVYIDQTNTNACSREPTCACGQLPAAV